MCHEPKAYLSHSFRVVILIKFCYSFKEIQGFPVQKMTAFIKLGQANEVKGKVYVYMLSSEGELKQN